MSQLQIEKKKLREEIDQKIAAIVKEKCVCEKSKKNLEILTEELKQSEEKNSKLEKSLQLRRKHIQKLERENSLFQSKILQDTCRSSNNSSSSNRKISKESEEAHQEEVLDSVGTTGSSNTNHDVMTMIDQRAKIYELRKSIKVWERKVEILKLSFKRVYMCVCITILQNLLVPLSIGGWSALTRTPANNTNTLEGHIYDDCTYRCVFSLDVAQPCCFP